ncbi:MAG: ABC transporter ATP-binding protein/permease [Faecalimonas sp.]|nr:ABC transporter ATP-binding protein/permease [Faecalimonas sp.]
MLQIKNISKQYKTGDLVQDALKDVSLNFRDNEFVSILGPSGSGKTTLLNIIGGLDRYDSGDLIINHVSTKNYKDRDWDSYRNHTIGFVFQSYNLIMHQTVLSNVELALTIGGISKKERKARALKALEEVGLKEQAHKKPNQMSGGQMQRVAIARALVNNPDILLADEPTGALDTETSVQVMELLKKVAKDRLVIMVTHNPELAETYSTRIVKLKDGKVTDDSDPFVLNLKDMKEPEHKNLGKAKMSIFTAFSLSFNNLLTKKARTILTSFAGSIGIIGIALILSLSTGFQNYIDKIQEDTLTSYPLTITSETADTTSMLLSMVSERGESTGKDSVRERQYISNMFSKIGTNDLTSFKKYLEKNDNKVGDMVNLVDYQYSVSPMIYTIDCNEEVTQLNPSTMMASMMGTSSSMMSMSPMSSSIFTEMLDDPETIHAQYDVLAGRWPKKYDEVILVLPEPNGMSDLLVYSLGLRDDKELMDMIAKIMAGEKVEETNEPLEWTYEELMDLQLRLVNPTDKYKYNETYNVYEDMSTDASYMQKVYDEALELKIVGVVSAKEGNSTGSLMSGVSYTKELTEYVIEQASESEIVKKQLADKEVDVFSGKRFDDESQDAGLDFQDMISVDTEMLSSAFGTTVSEKDISNLTEGYIGEISKAITTDNTKAKQALSDTFVTFATNMLKEYISANAHPTTGIAMIQMSQVDGVVNAFMAKESSQQALADLEAAYLVPKATYQAMYTEFLKGMLQGVITIQNVETPDDTQGGTTDSNIPGGGNSGTTDSTTQGGGTVGGATGGNTPGGGTVGDATNNTTLGGGSEQDMSAMLHQAAVEQIVAGVVSQEAIATAIDQLAMGMTEAVMQKTILSKVGELSGKLVSTVATSFNVDQEKIAGAFKFDMTEEEIARLMQTMTASSVEKNADTNLLSLGYQEIDKPTSMSFYFRDFESKERFLDFLDGYNDRMEKEDDEKVIKYTDLTGILMSSVKTIVDSVSYVLIAFVSISLIVSSIMIGIITYISVLERTKEIGVLRAIGASKKNISSIFNAETFIVGLCAGLLGIGVTASLVPLINYIIHSLTGNMDINAVLPIRAAIVLVILSVILTLIGGLIPSRQAAKKDPVLALRSE